MPQRAATAIAGPQVNRSPRGDAWRERGSWRSSRHQGKTLNAPDALESGRRSERPRSSRPRDALGGPGKVAAQPRLPPWARSPRGSGHLLPARKRGRPLGPPGTPARTEGAGGVTDLGRRARPPWGATEAPLASPSTGRDSTSDAAGTRPALAPATTPTPVPAPAPAPVPAPTRLPGVGRAGQGSAERTALDTGREPSAGGDSSVSTGGRYSCRSDELLLRRRPRLPTGSPALPGEAAPRLGCGVSRIGTKIKTTTITTTTTAKTDSHRRLDEKQTSGNRLASI
ncbi:skin secretory protein xP2-like [Cavia porcellus]|uniref:skin secretory protein xP2-like n=1 Tax=Cavia porcellus TaxID=10141 RepID=UPI002FE018C6